MKWITTVAVIFFLVGCQSSPPRKVAPEPKDDVREVWLELFQEKLKKNGPNMLCYQPAYNSCYKITELKCFNEVNTFNERCLGFAMKKNEPLASGNNVRKYIGSYSQCLVLNHLTSRGEGMKEIAGCLKGINLDNKKVLRALLE